MHCSQLITSIYAGAVGASTHKAKQQNTPHKTGGPIKPNELETFLPTLKTNALAILRYTAHTTSMMPFSLANRPKMNSSTPAHQRMGFRAAVVKIRSTIPHYHHVPPTIHTAP